MKENLIDISEMAARLNVPVSWIYSRTRTGAIPCIRFGKYVRFDPEEVIRWFRDKTMAEEG